MTPIEWNDNEPGFPDFLPVPVKPKTIWLTTHEARDRIEGVLKAAGIKAEFNAEDAFITFPDGARHASAGFDVLVDGYNIR